MNPEAKTVYTPPRPNLGPDPLAESPPWFEIAVVLAFAFLVSAFLVRRRRRRKRATPATNPPPIVPVEGADSPRERMIAWSRSIRESMAETFGASWLAKTTEELANDPSLINAIGPEHAAQLLTFLADADRTKFADALELPASPLADSELRELIDIIANFTPTTNVPAS
ncbi:hypothetical protein SAMN05444166_2681 [Singulisphaera sp. GP187]|uniref:hypothetical protein n=1 Tax=Singulisphaera sp. GP187 TaxID=1882752 RepID=UPI000926686E|nr:hypothetical protein [Singulisphaera sp. GP187]SIO14369.1 hypothetical protein SAMN05444166_2681 [Singulisphaera sp. GP187]